jgi:hypothetical protein
MSSWKVGVRERGVSPFLISRAADWFHFARIPWSRLMLSETSECIRLIHSHDGARSPVCP